MTGQGASAKKVLEVGEGLWESRIRKNASEEAVGSYYRAKRKFYAKEGESILIVKGREGEGASFCGGSAEERLH